MTNCQIQHSVSVLDLGVRFGGLGGEMEVIDIPVRSAISGLFFSPFRQTCHTM